MKTLICFGDSITAGEAFADGTPRLTPRLRQALPGMAVRNAGIPGENSGDGLRRLRRDVLAHGPDLVQILFGANEADGVHLTPAGYERLAGLVIPAVKGLLG